MKNLILTMAAGRYQEIKDLIYPRFGSYAFGCKAHFEVIEECKFPECPVLDKLRMAEYFDRYDRILFLDADILVRDDCPNLFDLVDEERVAAYDEGSTLWHLKDLIHRIHDVNNLSELWGLPKADWPGVVKEGEILPFYNAGVMLLSKQHRCLLEAPALDPLPNPKGKVPCAEQCYLNWTIRKHKPKMHHLPVCFNQMPYNRTADYRFTSYMLHYAGFENFDARVEQMNRDNEFWKKNDLG
jgi:lipopolysaccharide biosynthesis glycosyltransferase